MPVSAYILIQVKAGTARLVADKVKNLENVRMAHAVTGPYDVIAYIETLSLLEVGETVSQIHKIDGVERTQTCIQIL